MIRWLFAGMGAGVVLGLATLTWAGDTFNVEDTGPNPGFGTDFDIQVGSCKPGPTPGSPKSRKVSIPLGQYVCNCAITDARGAAPGGARFAFVPCNKNGDRQTVFFHVTLDCSPPGGATTTARVEFTLVEKGTKSSFSSGKVRKPFAGPVTEEYSIEEKGDTVDDKKNQD